MSLVARSNGAVPSSLRDVRSCILLSRRLRLAGCRAHLQSLEGGRKQQRSALAAAASEAGSTAIAGPCCTGEPSLKGSSIESKSCHRAAQEGGDGTLA